MFIECSLFNRYSGTTCIQAQPVFRHNRYSGTSIQAQQVIKPNKYSSTTDIHAQQSAEGGQRSGLDTRGRYAPFTPYNRPDRNRHSSVCKQLTGDQLLYQSYSVNMTWGNTDKSYEDNVGCHDCGGVTSDVGPGFDSRICHDTYRFPCGRGLQAGRVIVKGMYAKRRPVGSAVQQSQGVQTLRPNTVRGTTPKVKSSLVASMLTPKLVSGTSIAAYSSTEELVQLWHRGCFRELVQLGHSGYFQELVQLGHSGYFRELVQLGHSGYFQELVQLGHSGYFRELVQLGHSGYFRELDQLGHSGYFRELVQLGHSGYFRKLVQLGHSGYFRKLVQLGHSGYFRKLEEPESDYTQSESNEEYQLTNHGYGKNSVKVLHVHREGARHTIREYEVDTRLRLHSNKDYLTGDNTDIIATDTQKNTVYLLAKKYGVESPEDFALLLCNHFLYTYRHVDEVSVHVEEYPWERLQVDSVDHNHAFIFSPKALRFCTVTQARNGEQGTNYCDKKCGCEHNLKFCPSRDIVKECILDKFAGPPEKGVFSPSVQNTLYLTEKMALDKVPQICRIEMHMPNKHYFTLDLSKFPSLVKGENKEVYQPVDKPSGIIHAILERKSRSKL
uniref:Uricase n=1 Tax=Timema monikensis TaxID=170555 RepID=A0A7R9EED5_9NEOP|nr:unnamed protein product [Timema monikensis]